MKTKVYFVLSSLFFLSLSACGKKAPKTVTIKVNEISSSVTIHTSEQKVVLDSNNPADQIEDNLGKYGKKSNSKPLPITLSWKEENDINEAASKYEIRLSEKEDFSNPLTYFATDNTLDVYNLKINTRYYYSITSYHGKHSYLSDTNSFIINDSAPRNLFIDGVENCRDLGGWNIGEGKVYKQGLIYRTAQFNYGGDANTFESEPTELGKAALKELNIKTDIDLRKTISFSNEDEINGITSSPLGEDVKYVSCPMVYGNQNIFTQSENLPSIRLFFETLADESNYPIAFHCMRGTDRTGALAYVLGALVGMSEEDLMMDYLFSDLANIGSPVLASKITGEDFFVQGIANSDGDGLKEKAKNYLINTVGVETSTLERITSILVEK